MDWMMVMTGHDATLTLMMLRSFGIVTVVVVFVLYALYTLLSLKASYNLLLYVSRNQKCFIITFTTYLVS